MRAASGCGSGSYHAVLTLKKKCLLCQAYDISKIQDTEGGLSLSEAVLTV